jgi:hypothetical protein
MPAETGGLEDGGGMDKLAFEISATTGLPTDLWNVWQSQIWTPISIAKIRLSRDRLPKFPWAKLLTLPGCADYLQAQHPQDAAQILEQSDDTAVMFYDALVAQFNAALPMIRDTHDIEALLGFLASAYEMINGPDEYDRVVAAQISNLRETFTKAGWIKPERL